MITWQGILVGAAIAAPIAAVLGFLLCAMLTAGQNKSVMCDGEDTVYTDIGTDIRKG